MGGPEKFAVTAYPRVPAVRKLKRGQTPGLTRGLTLSPRAPATGGRSDASGAAEPDRHVLAVDDHRHRAPALAETEHPLEVGFVLLDVDVFEFYVPPLMVLPGGCRVGSSVLAEDGDHAFIVRSGRGPDETV
jgi:hypothetical protein